MKMDGGNQRLFTDDCTSIGIGIGTGIGTGTNSGADAARTMIFPQNSYAVVTSTVSALRHTATESTPPKITSSLTKVSISNIDFLSYCVRDKIQWWCGCDEKNTSFPARSWKIRSLMNSSSKVDDWAVAVGWYTFTRCLLVSENDCQTS